MLSAQSDVMNTWARQARLPQDVAPAGVLTDEAERDLVGIIKTRFNGEFSFTNLDWAVLLRKENKEREQREVVQQVREAERLTTLFDEIDKVLEQTDSAGNLTFPTFAKDQANFDRIRALSTNTSFTVADFVADITAHPGSWSWTSPTDLTALLRKNTSAQLVAAGYDPAKIQKAENQMARSIHRHAESFRPSWKPDTSAKQKADAEAVAKKAQAALEADPKAIAKATESCEDILKSFRASNNFAENDRARESLAQVVVETNGVFDPFATKKAREQWIREYVPEAERKH